MAKKSAISKYMAQIGSKGGKAGKGKAKARPSDQARKAVQKRWGKRDDAGAEAGETKPSAP